MILTKSMLMKSPVRYTYLHEDDALGVKFLQSGQLLILPTTVKHMHHWTLLLTAACGHGNTEMGVVRMVSGDSPSHSRSDRTPCIEPHTVGRHKLQTEHVDHVCRITEEIACLAVTRISPLPKFITSNILSALSSDVVASSRPSGLTDMSRIFPARRTRHKKR